MLPEMFSLHTFKKNELHQFCSPHNFIHGYTLGENDEVIRCIEGSYVIGKVHKLVGKTSGSVLEQRMKMANFLSSKVINKYHKDKAGIYWMGVSDFEFDKDGNFTQEVSFVAFECV